MGVTSRGRRARVGWSLVETLVAAAVVAVLAGLTLAGVHATRVSASRVACANTLRQVATAIHSYSAQHQQFPEGCAYPFASATAPSTTQVGLSWHSSILPYVEQTSLWEIAWQANKRDPSGQTVAHTIPLATPVRLFVCPADARTVGGDGLGGEWGLTSFVGVAGTGLRANNGLFHPGYTVRMVDVTDGLSNTLLVGERPPGPNGRYGGWYANWGDCTCPVAQLHAVRHVDPLVADGVSCPGAPALAPGAIENPCSVFHFWSLHPGGAHFLLADGSARFLTYAAAPLLPALASRAGGETTAVPD